jgi:hypothetical protein
MRRLNLPKSLLRQLRHFHPYRDSVTVVRKRLAIQISIVLAIFLVLFVYGAIPFLMLPSTGVVGWVLGFSASLANGGLFDFYAHDFGIPQPAPIPFGLALAWPVSLLVRTGMHVADAYSLIATFWLLLAMFSAYRTALRFGGTKLVALLGAVTWMTMPTIWSHSEYSALSLGIALLSFYFLASFKLFSAETTNTKISPATIVLYGIATVISVFMDGYTFMMFATGATILLIYSLITRPDVRSILLRVSVPIHIGSFTLATYLYTSYVRKSNFSVAPLDFFRGWGVDLTFIAIPPKGLLWLPDLLELSVERSSQVFFGDPSVWMTTFSLPILLLGLIGWAHSRRRVKISTGILLISIFGFYMSLGPSLKINSIKPAALQSIPLQWMAPEFAIAPTGNGWISEVIVGFNDMRASYRWSALGIFALWLLAVILISTTDRNLSRKFLLLVSIVLVINLPNFGNQLNSGITNRSMFLQIDQELIPELRERIKTNETVAFLPWGNDFFANYLAPKVGFRTFNIGGDKNLEIAKSYWPDQIVFSLGNADVGNGVISSTNILIDGTVDVVVLPYFDMIWAIHTWPCPADRKELDWPCPAERRVTLEPLIRDLRSLPFVEVVDTDLFATIRLRPEFSTQAMRRLLMSDAHGGLRYPLETNSKSAQNIKLLLYAGWSQLEVSHVWSKGQANLMVPVPKECTNTKCEVNLKFFVHGASEMRPVDVRFRSASIGWEWSKQITAVSGGIYELNVPLISAKISQNISISIPTATSPAKLVGSTDIRELGIALMSIELIKP